jgi:hypothetical protein
LADPQPGDSGGATRQWLAFIIVALSIVLIAVGAALAIGFASPEGRPEATRLVFTSVLPLLGTWVGTVLAFYFARENLQAAQAATESTLRLTSGLESRQPVSEVMIPKDKITSYDLQSGEDPGTVKLADLLSRMESSKRRRIPIIGEAGNVLYVFHDSTIGDFAHRISKDPRDLDRFTETVSDLVRDDAFRKAVESIGFVGPDADVAQARTAMRSVDLCNDVFVTAKGQRTDPVVGWLTNTDLAGLQ